jgi:hypothetical protein
MMIRRSDHAHYTQKLCDRPCLRDTADRTMWCVGLVDLVKLAQAFIGQAAEQARDGLRGFLPGCAAEPSGA